MAKELTARQRQVYEAIRTYLTQKGYPPSVRELCKALNIRSLRGVTIHLDALERKGWIERQRTSRSIRLLPPAASSPPVYIPLLGTIAAGLPLLAVENVESFFPLPPEFAASSGNLFALRVKGDSMIGDHITDGDTIIVRSQSSAEHGQLVAALIADEATVKRLDLRSTPRRLLPSNPKYSPIQLARDEARVLGTVVGLIRRYHAS